MVSRTGVPGQGGYLAARTECANGHDLTDARNLYPDLPGRRHARRCRVCIREANDLRRAAYTHLGMSQKDYLATHGSSREAAVKVLRGDPWQ